MTFYIQQIAVLPKSGVQKLSEAVFCTGYLNNSGMMQKIASLCKKSLRFIFALRKKFLICWIYFFINEIRI
ncbi:Uncharacterized protein dnm_079550 [Desulfonema magnum]|uniref:Uncharacterized protein n=1 Tax=Desulfonema magnum TaxID=45655 RepID=A0A975BU98_9BACT|nr:Uncharacterized protein dnm_079550 [Desulfonema magnum]